MDLLYNKVEYVIAPKKSSDQIPYHLLLLADENPHLIEAYLPLSQVYLLFIGPQVQGVYLLRVDSLEAEIMNIAIEPAYQGKGLGKALLAHAIKEGKAKGLQRLQIKTGNSSIRQISLYQQQGFDLIAVNYNFFLESYPLPIWENNIQCKHQLIFELVL